MKSIKCPKCELTNWSTADSCKVCGALLPQREVRSNSHPALSPYLQGDSRNFAKYQPPPPDKSLPPASTGVLMIILGCLLVGVSLYFISRAPKWPLYFPILGFSFIASGVIFCMREWIAVYVYLTGLAIAACVMFATEDVKMPWSRLFMPILIGLLLLNKRTKAKKVSVSG